MIFGERSNGKTYAVLDYAIDNYSKGKGQLAIIRRWDEDFKGKRGKTMFDALESNNEIAKKTGGEWTSIYYYASKWYFAKYDEEGNRTIADEPFAFAFSITQMEHDKSTSYPNVTTILFDEFLTRTAYLPDEFVLFMNVISTIVRSRTNVKIFMLGNTVNKYCPYFKEMGLKHIKEMSPGDIDVYTYGQSDLKVAVEYTLPNKQGKESDFYFAFDNPKLHMITGGAWEVDIYPHCPLKYKPNEIMFRYFIIFSDELLECEIVLHEEHTFTFIHKRTKELRTPEKELIFTTEASPLPNHRMHITKPHDKIGKKIAKYFIEEKVFYSDNEVGEIVRNYLVWCGKKL